jgi:hypothetical protein
MKNRFRSLHFTLWPTVFVTLLTAGAGAALWTMLFPSQGEVPRLCFGLAVCCGSDIVAGSMTLALGARVFERLRARSLVPALLLLGCSGEVVLVLGELCMHRNALQVWRLGIGVWSAHSVLAGAVWTLLIYFLSVVAEFVPGKQGNRHLVHSSRIKFAQITTIAAAAVLANFHHFSTASKVIAEQERMSPLWAKEFSELPLFLTSLCVALAALLFGSIRAYEAWGRAFEPELLERVRIGLIGLLILSLGIRGGSLTQEALAQLSHSPYLFTLWFVEVGTLVASPVFLSRGPGEGQPPNWYAGAATVLVWVVASRLNTIVTAFPGFGLYYVPSLTDVLLSFAILGIGVAGFAAASWYLCAFPAVGRQQSVV